ncbi:LysR family transcriptional regulator [Oceanibaculum indicum]|uniref:LysR family transcriptional regulator n=1 Tax=Oceanibaculum indicum P24 TaxID=1207063 RepID=K2JW12_9PROT|nr:LysR family transcriptional regulator [Oceanibaculum indicum]EKE78747.1 LysR family transcriptional regulator [Oceanibaculum indicum P24]
MVNLRNLDLNLLVTLDALLQEQHVTRAAKRLGLTQPAVSNALERLRYLFKDPLLERAGPAMKPTPRADALREPLRQALADLSNIVAGPSAPDISQIEQTVRIVMTDLAAELLTPRLYARAAREAPGLGIAVLPWLGPDRTDQSILRGEADIAITIVLSSSQPDMRRELLSYESYAVAMRPDHPAAEAFDLARWLAYPHLILSARGDPHGVVDDILAGMGLRRQVRVTVNSFMTIPRLLATSDLLAMLPARFLSTVPREYRLIGRPPPIDMPGLDLFLQWHPRRDSDIATQTVRGWLKEAMAEK